MTMIERVVNAIQNEPSLRGVIPNGWRNMVDWDAVARAAIQAMREPDIDMLGAGITEWGLHDDSEEDVAGIFAAMIDAALEE